MLFDLATFIAFMSGSTATAAGSVITLGSAGYSVTKLLGALQKSKREDSDYNDLLWNAFIESANETFLRRIAAHSLLDGFKYICQNKFEKSEITHRDKFSFIQDVYNQGQLLDIYSVYYSEMRTVLTQKRMVPLDHIGDLFKNIEVEAFSNWRQKFCSMCDSDSLLKEWLNQKQLMGIVYVASGADLHLLQRQVKGEYWAQTFTFDNSIDPFPARPDNLVPAAQEKWWMELSRQLEAGPIFLIGPGGIGKSAFLVYLYQTIERRPRECPFGGVFLLSLDTLLSENKIEIDSDGMPFTNPDQSILLSRIANKAGGNNTCEDWRTMLKWGTLGTANKPILILLDGLNEMRSRKLTREDVYQYIVNEIAALANRKEFRNARLIITSRIEATGSKGTNESQEQLNDFPTEDYAGEVNFQICTLNGISLDLPESGSLSNEMRELLHRPMYYKHFQNRTVPLTQYDALKDMYHVLSEQSIGNLGTCDRKRKRQRQCVFEILLPMIAYHLWADRDSSKKALRRSYKEFVEKCTLQLIADRFTYSNTTEAVNFARAVCKEADNLLKQQEQILILSNGQYIFRHQDYRDYLVAEYFLQRLAYLRPTSSNCELYDDVDIKPWIDSLRLNTYGQDILKLIYQALSFQTNYVNDFTIKKTLRDVDFTPACILWYTIAYQLSDLKGLTGVTYDGNLQEDTLTVLKPLIDYVLEKTVYVGVRHRHSNNKVLPTLSSKLKFHLTEVLMKACELYRNKGNYSRALEITKAAMCVYNNHPRTMASVINHNIAMVHLYNFMASGDTQELPNSLKTLRKCAEGSLTVPPYRYSCTVFALMLVSPHPKLKAQPAYEKFVTALSKETPLSVRAFWAYYDAIFDERKQGEDWQPRLYSLRQLLFLLAENKVKAVLGPGFDMVAIESLANMAYDNITICVPDLESPLPTADSLRLIRILLKKIERFDEGWMHYINGLISYYIDNDREKAHYEFNLAYENSNHKDIRSALWLAYLEENRKQLHQIYKAGLENAKQGSINANMKINAYHVGEYYERDIGRLYLALCTL